MCYFFTLYHWSGIGGEFGIGMAIVTETWAPDMRARATSWVALGWQGGVLLAAVIPAIIVPMFGWRAVFLVGLVPALNRNLCTYAS